MADDAEAPKEAKKRGKRTRLTPELIERLCRFIAAGNTQGAAARACNIGEETFYNYLREGRNGRGNALNRELVERVEKALGDAEARAVMTITNAFKRDWKAAAWWLERRKSGKWGRKDAIDVRAGSAAQGGPATIVFRLRPDSPPGVMDKELADPTPPAPPADGGTFDDDEEV